MRRRGYRRAALSPLARGRLTRDWNSGSAREEHDAFGKSLYQQTEDADRHVVEAVARVAERRGIPRAQVAMAWLLQKPEVSAPIVGASRDGHLQDAVAALALTLDADERQELEAAYIPHPVVGFQ